MVIASASAPQPGDQVQVEWGFEDVVGTVLEVYGTGVGVRVRVAVPVLGPDGEVLDTMKVTLPLSIVH